MRAKAHLQARFPASIEKQGTFRATGHGGRLKRYVIDMFPYTSGVGSRRVQFARDASEADARAAALAVDGIAAGETVRKFVYVPGQVVNLVVG